MNDLRRTLLAGYSALLVLACAGLAALAWDQAHQLDIDLGGFRMVAGVSSGTAEKWIFTLLLACVALFGLLTFFIALVGGPRRHDIAVVRQADGSELQVTSEAAARIAKDAVDRLPDVRRSRVAVRFVRDRADVQVTAGLHPLARPEHMAGAIAHTIGVALEEQFGLQLANQPVVRIAFDAPHEPLPGMPPPPEPRTLVLPGVRDD